MSVLPPVLILILSLLAGCAPRGPRPAAPPPPSTVFEEQPEPTGAQVPEARLAVVLKAHPAGLTQLADFLEAHSEVRLTFVPPPATAFEGPGGPALLQRFKVFASSQQIDVALILENEPILPLLGDLRLAGDRVARWNFEFRWPEDIAAQLARGIGRHQRLWGRMPTGVAPPYQALSPDVLNAGRRFRLTWALSRTLDRWGLRVYDDFAVVAPPRLPDTSGTTVGSPEWADQLALWTLTHPFAVIDAGAWGQPEHLKVFLERLVATAQEKRPGLRFVTIDELASDATSLYPLPPDASPFDLNYSSWVVSSHQRRAWQALAEARAVLEAYKNSGRARLNRLDAATEEMLVAESGPFLLSLARPSAANITSERTFLATVANVYRLSGTPVPPQLNNWFAYRGGRNVRVAEEENDRPFFVEGTNTHVWNDPRGDDIGAGRAAYPVGAYPRGTFDLRDLSLSWNDTEVTFSISMVDLPSAQSVPVAPLVDVYVDVNRLPGAGGLDPLPDRGGQIAREAAWEYAVSVSPFTAVVWQSLPGGETRRIQSRTVEQSGNALVVSVPRSVLRGDPSQWRMTVALMGTENNRKNETLLPVPILSSSGERNFGGAPTARSRTALVDVLAPTAEAQDELLQGLQVRGRGVLPYIESPQP